MASLAFFFFRKHCTLPTTLEMGKITNPLNHCTFLRINLQINVPLKTLKMAFLKPWIETFCGDHAPSPTFFPACVHLQSFKLYAWQGHDISAVYTKSNNKLEKPSLVNYSIALKGSKSQMGKAEVAERFLVSDYCEPEFVFTRRVKYQGNKTRKQICDAIVDLDFAREPSK